MLLYVVEPHTCAGILTQVSLYYSTRNKCLYCLSHCILVSFFTVTKIMTDSFSFTDIGRQTSLLLVERSGKYFILEWTEKFRLINVGECHNENPCILHCKIQLCASKESHIVFIFEVYFWDKVGKVDDIFINFTEMKLQSVSSGEMIFVITILLRNSTSS